MRKAYLKLFIDNVTISTEEIHVSGPKGVLAKAALAGLADTPGEVFTFVREWRGNNGVISSSGIESIVPSDYATRRSVRPI